MDKEDKFKRKITRIVEVTVGIVFIFLLIIGVLAWKASFSSNQAGPANNVQKSNINFDDSLGEDNIVIVFFRTILSAFDSLANNGDSFVNSLGEIVYATLLIVAVIFFQFALGTILNFLVKNLFFPIHVIARPIAFVVILLGKKLGWFQELQKPRKLYEGSFPSKLLNVSNFLYSKKTQKEVFEQIGVDWFEEYFEALSEEEYEKAYWINVRYTCTFIFAMVQKSPLGDLIEFISKIAK